MVEGCAGDGGPAGQRGGPVLCAGCGLKIQERWYLLAVDRAWHGSCLKCCECKAPLETQLTCFFREGSIFCREDYYRLFGSRRCSRCQLPISSHELVMRARDAVFHLHCFNCTSCNKPLTKGEEFGMRSGLVYCREHYQILCGDLDLYTGSSSPRSSYFNGTTTVQKGRPRKRKAPDVDLVNGSAAGFDMLQGGDLSRLDTMTYETGGQGSAGSRAKRMRTSFKHHQLRTMKSYFNLNQNPDAKDLKQLSQKTGLSKRVLQVWFQNARAKWRRNMLRQGNQGADVSQLTDGRDKAVISPSDLSTQSLHSMGMPLSDLPPPHLEENSEPPLSYGELYG